MKKKEKKLYIIKKKKILFLLRHYMDEISEMNCKGLCESFFNMILLFVVSGERPELYKFHESEDD